MVRLFVENDRIAKTVHVGECVGSRPVGRPRNHEGILEKERFGCQGK